MKLRSFRMCFAILLAYCWQNFATAAPIEVLFPEHSVRKNSALSSEAIRCDTAPANKRAQDSATIPCTAAAKAWVLRTWTKSDLSPKIPLLLNQLSTTDPNKPTPQSCSTQFGNLKIRISPGAVPQSWERTATSFRFRCGESELTSFNRKLYFNCRSAGDIPESALVAIETGKLSVNEEQRDLLNTPSEDCQNFSFSEYIQSLRNSTTSSSRNKNSPEETESVAWKDRRLLIFPKSFVEVHLNGEALRIGTKTLTLSGNRLKFDDGSTIELQPNENIVIDYGSAYVRGSAEIPSESLHQHHH